MVKTEHTFYILNAETDIKDSKFKLIRNQELDFNFS